MRPLKERCLLGEGSENVLKGYRQGTEESTVDCMINQRGACVEKVDMLVIVEIDNKMERLGRELAELEVVWVEGGQNGIRISTNTESAHVGSDEHVGVVR